MRNAVSEQVIAGTDLAAEWQRLVRKWDDAYAVYERLASAASVAGVDGSDQPVAVREARDRLNEIRRRMNDVIALGGSRRREQVTMRDHLVIGVVERGVENISMVSQTSSTSSPKKATAD